jgi:hypothetical protein
MKVLVSSFLICLTSFFGFSQDFDWAKSLGGTDSDSAIAVVVDNLSSVYTVGNFSGTADFNPDSIKPYELTSVGLQDIFIQKTDAFGDFMWAKKIGGSGIDKISAIKILNNKIYIFGSFQNSVIFGNETKTSNGLSDCFIAELDTAANFVWVKTFGATQNDIIKSAEVTSEGIFLVGEFSGNMEQVTGDFSMFIQKRTLIGNVVWTKSIGNARKINGNSIAVDSIGAVYLVGVFNGEKLDFNANSQKDSLLTSEKIPNTSIFTDDIFILKLNELGDFKWVRKVGSVSPDAALSAYLKSDFFVVTGFYQGLNTDFGNLKKLTSTGKEDVFVARYDLNGTCLWVKGVGGPKTDIGRSIYTDMNNNIYIAGSFQDNLGTTGVDFNPGSGTFYLKSEKTINAFYLKLKESGDFIFAGSYGGAGVDQATFISVDKMQDVMIVGNYERTAAFDSQKLYSKGVSDAFILKTIKDKKKTVVVKYDLGGINPDSVKFELQVSGRDLKNIVWRKDKDILVGSNHPVDGDENTILIDSIQGLGDLYASISCSNFFLEKSSEIWYLPSLEELKWMYKNKELLGGFKEGTYWSSTENDISKAAGVSFIDGSVVLDLKSKRNYIRPVRKWSKAEVGLKLNLINNFSIYPNPASSNVYVELSKIDNNSYLSLVSVSGEQVYNTKVNTKEVTIPLESVAKGIYILNYSSDAGMFTTKIVVE